jgi:hypothetical protein
VLLQRVLGVGEERPVHIRAASMSACLVGSGGTPRRRRRRPDARLPRPALSPISAKTAWPPPIRLVPGVGPHRSVGRRSPRESSKQVPEWLFRLYPECGMVIPFACAGPTSSRSPQASSVGTSAPARRSSGPTRACGQQAKRSAGGSKAIPSPVHTSCVQDHLDSPRRKSPAAGRRSRPAPDDRVLGAAVATTPEAGRPVERR